MSNEQPPKPRSLWEVMTSADSAAAAAPQADAGGQTPRGEQSLLSDVTPATVAAERSRSLWEVMQQTAPQVPPPSLQPTRPRRENAESGESQSAEKTRRPRSQSSPAQADARTDAGLQGPKQNQKVAAGSPGEHDSRRKNSTAAKSRQGQQQTPASQSMTKSASSRSPAFPGATAKQPTDGVNQVAATAVAPVAPVLFGPDVESTEDTWQRFSRPQSRSGLSRLAIVGAILSFAAVPMSALALLPPVWLRFPATAVGFAGLVASLMALGEIKRSRGRQTGTTLAWIGMIVGTVAMFIGPLVLAPRNLP